MKKYYYLLLMMLVGIVAANCSSDYESVPNDPMGVRICTLENGLKIYLSVNKDQPRIQTYIAVRAGGKNDPAETTGLSHYLEHLMFKGTESFGTSNYEAEKPLLDEIENIYEVYRKETDPEKRKELYHNIDSISYEASKYSIANEYDKLMAAIGANGTNAFTSEDVTCYTEDIPSNQIENWAKIQSDRFKNMVIRGFHTELETVYEEYNIGLADDMDKVFETINSVLFPNHPYGKQTVIGKGEHLKNPSITNIKNHFAKWYVPNNVAICMSGDFDPDKTVEIIKQYFGDWKANPNVDAQRAELDSIKLEPLTAPVKKTVYGLEAAEVVLGWAMPGNKSKDNDYVEIMANIFSNGQAGLFDIDLNQSQKVLAAGTGTYGMTDFSAFLALANPKNGQTLDEAKDLMLAEVEKLKSGNFDDKLLESIINNMKIDYMRQLENNRSRVSMLMNSFVNGTEWKDEVERIDRLSKITKQQVVDFANKYLTEGYVCVYKVEGEDTTIHKIDKPAISPIEMNRDNMSEFVKEISESKVDPIQPVFVDFKKDMSLKNYDNGDELLYKKNETNGTFVLQMRIDRGSKADKELSTASDYLSYLGTDKMTAEEIQRELYRLACSSTVSVSTDRSYITISGLAENMAAAVELCNDWIMKAQVDSAVYANLVADELKSRADAKLDQRTCFNALYTYGRYGALNSRTNIMSAKELEEANPQALLDKIADLLSYKKTIVYYGPDDMADVEKLLDSELNKTDLKDGVKFDVFPYLPVEQSEVLIAPYDAKNIYMMSQSINGQKYDAALVPQIELFNEYFGGGMNGVVFQEMRESRGLCYSASASYVTPSFKDNENVFYTYIITQNDKMMDALEAFSNIVENMPQSEKAFKLAKDATIQRLATARTIRENVLFEYLFARNMGLDYDINKDVYEKVQNMTLKDVTDFQQKNVKGRTYRYCILGNEKELDMEALGKVAPIKKLTLEDIFGY